MNADKINCHIVSDWQEVNPDSLQLNQNSQTHQISKNSAQDLAQDKQQDARKLLMMSAGPVVCRCCIITLVESNKPHTMTAD